MANLRNFSQAELISSAMMRLRTLASGLENNQAVRTETAEATRTVTNRSARNIEGPPSCVDFLPSAGKVGNGSSLESYCVVSQTQTVRGQIRRVNSHLR